MFVVVAIGSSVRFDGFNSDSNRVIAVDIPETVQKDQPSRSDSGRLQGQNKRYHGIESLRHDAIIDTFSTIIGFKSFQGQVLLRRSPSAFSREFVAVVLIIIGEWLDKDATPR